MSCTFDQIKVRIFLLITQKTEKATMQKRKRLQTKQTFVIYTSDPKLLSRLCEEL